MIDLTPIAKPIQKRLFEKMKLLGRENNSPNKPVSVGGLTHNQLAVRSPFIRMVSGLQDPVILMGGELAHSSEGGGMIAGFNDIYGVKSNKNFRSLRDQNFKRPIP